MSGVASESMDDLQLIACIRSGSEDAAAILYERYARRLEGLADRQMSAGIRRVTEPEDIVQSAFRSLFRGVRSGAYSAPEGRSLWNLLAVIAVHKVRRKATRQRSVTGAVSLSAAPDSDTFGTPEDALSPEGFEAALRECIESLSEDERTVVTLRIEGYTVEEISDRLSRSRRTVERQLQRIREQLTEDLSDDD